jgi:hypothetical protein
MAYGSFFQMKRYILGIVFNFEAGHEAGDSLFQERRAGGSLRQAYKRFKRPLDGGRRCNRRYNGSGRLFLSFLKIKRLSKF